MRDLEYPTARWARELPDHPAIIANGSSISYHDFEGRILAAARALARHGVGSADRVIICAANSLAYVIAVHAITRIGAIVIPIATRSTAAEVEICTSRYHPRLILADDSTSPGWRDATCLDAVTAIKPSEIPPAVSPDIDPEALHSIIQTSGSEGEPKGVCLSFRNHLANALGSALNLGVRPDDRWLLNLPLSHVGGLAIILRAAIYGTTVIVHERFDPDMTWRAIAGDRVTQLSLVATTLRRLLQAHPDRLCPDYLRTIMVGGGPVPALLIDEARKRGYPVLPTYGMTETSSQIATLSPSAPESKWRTAGYPLALSEIEIRDEDGATLPAGEEGRIHVRGPMLALGYWHADGRIRDFRDQDEWFATNDTGSLEDDGCLLVHGRIDNVIISGGEKIHAEEIENALTQHESVARGVVIGIDDTEWGQRPVAYVEARSGRLADPQDMMRFLADKLPRYKLPVRIEFLAEIPTLPSGKVDRKSMHQHRD